MKAFVQRLLRRPYSGWLLFFVFYLAVFFLLEKLRLDYHLIHVPLDDLIPFNSLFFPAYFSWYLVFFGLPVLFLWQDTRDYLRLCVLQFGPVLICFLAYFLYPTMLDLRPEHGSGLFGWAMDILWSIDPPMNVCPSLHVCSSLSAAIGFTASSRYRRSTKVWFDLWMVLIIASTVFLRQHSVVDVFWGIVIVLPFALFVFLPAGKRWLDAKAGRHR